MEYRKMGRTGLKVSTFCLGTMMFGRQVEENLSIRIIEEALGAGVNFIDTADMYVNGVTEEIVGNAPERRMKPLARLDVPPGSGAVAFMTLSLPDHF